VLAALEQAAALRDRGRWPEVRAALEAAEKLVTPSTPFSTREQLRRAAADAALVGRLEDVRLWDGTRRRGATPHSLGELYAAAFRSGGIDPKDTTPWDVASKLEQSRVCQTLLAFMHDWLYWASDADKVRLRESLDLADGDRWRTRFREVLADRDDAALQALAAEPEAASQPPVMLSLVAVALGNGEDAKRLLREAQQHHPNDFWINYQLGEFVRPDRPLEAAGYFRVAVAIRPDSDQAYARLGEALRDAADVDAAIVAFRRAVELNPERAPMKDPAKVLAARDRLAEAQALWKDVLQRDPPDHNVWYGYAQLCLYLGREQDYRRVRGALLERFGGVVDPWWVAERVALASLLLPTDHEDLQRVAEAAGRAAAAGSKTPDATGYLRFLQGMAQYRQGNFAQAIPLLRDAAEQLPNRPGPPLALSMAQFRCGNAAEARATMAAAVLRYNWKPSQADHPTVWASHVLRREAEALILPRLGDFLRGDYRPQDRDERLAMLGACQSQGRNAAAAQLFADAFRGDLVLADRLTSDCLDRAARESKSVDRIEVLNMEPRYVAARCAALTYFGVGTDVAGSTDVDRQQWLMQARAWLEADLDACIATLEGHPDLVQRMMQLWKADRELAPLREPAALSQLAPMERDGWAALWKHVDEVASRAQGSIRRVTTTLNPPLFLTEP
jgi:serine/threonine-protein kinase